MAETNEQNTPAPADPMETANRIVADGVQSTAAFGVSATNLSLSELIALEKFKRETASADAGITELRVQPGSTRY